MNHQAQRRVCGIVVLIAVVWLFAAAVALITTVGG